MDNTQKYVKIGRYNEIIIFPCTIEHSTFKHLNPVSAGFCYINCKKIDCFGESYSLDLKSNKEDSFFATRQIFGIDAI
jgi:hypothetical protein